MARGRRGQGEPGSGGRPGPGHRGARRRGHSRGVATAPPWRCASTWTPPRCPSPPTRRTGRWLRGSLRENPRSCTPADTTPTWPSAWAPPSCWPRTRTGAAASSFCSNLRRKAAAAPIPWSRREWWTTPTTSPACTWADRRCRWAKWPWRPPTSFRPSRWRRASAAWLHTPAAPPNRAATRCWRPARPPWRCTPCPATARAPPSSTSAC